MRWKQKFGLTLALLFACARPALAQAVPAATQKSLPFAIGAGFSGYNPDYGHGRLLGGTLWIDYAPDWVPSLLRGIGLEIEARDLNYGRSSSLPGNLRQDVAEGGVMYSWPRFRNFRPYGKISWGYGNLDSETQADHRYSISRTIFSGGGGVEYRVSQRVWVRADYEYQSWPDFFKHSDPTISAGRLNPQGFTIGALYQFGFPYVH